MTSTLKLLLLICVFVATQLFPNPYYRMDFYYYGFPLVYGSRSTILEYIDDLKYTTAGMTWLSPSWEWEIVPEYLAANGLVMLVAIFGTFRPWRMKWFVLERQVTTRTCFFICALAGIAIAIHIQDSHFLLESIWCANVTILLGLFIRGLASIMRVGVTAESTRPFDS